MERQEMTDLLPIDGSGPEIPKAPRGLKREGRKLWRDIQQAYDFTEAPEKVTLLERACRTADVVDRLQKIVDEATDLRVKGSQGQPVSIPEIGELRQYSTLLANLLKSLTLPDEDETAGNGLTRSQIGRLGAKARWGGAGVVR
jgi:hypothetical protein